MHIENVYVYKSHPSVNKKAIYETKNNQPLYFEFFSLIPLSKDTNLIMVIIH